MDATLETDEFSGVRRDGIHFWAGTQFHQVFGAGIFLSVVLLLFG